MNVEDQKKANSAFSDEEEREIKKVFSMVDKDGSGTIDASELAIIVKNLTGTQPSKESLDMFIQKVDGNVDGEKDGKIQWEEFRKALSEWVQPDFSSAKVSTPRASRKRGRAEVQPPRFSRAKLHKKIASFFVCFKQSDDFDALRLRFRSLEHKNKKTGMQDEIQWGRQAKSSEDKAKYLEDIKSALNRIGEVSRAIHSDNFPQAKSATKYLAKMMAVTEYYPTPEERFEHSDVIIRLFSRVKESNIIRRLSQFLKDKAHAELQYESLRIITYYAPGPRIAHTPKNSPNHPSKMMHKNEIAQVGVIPTIIELMKSPVMPVRTQAAAALAAVASYNHEARDKLIKMGCIEPMVALIRPNSPKDELRPVTWALSVFFGRTHATEDLPSIPKGLILNALQRFQYIIERINDKETLVNAACAMSYLLPGVKIPDDVIKRLCQLLTYPYPPLQGVLLRCFDDLVQLQSSEDPYCLLPEKQIKTFFELGLLEQVRKLLEQVGSETSEVRLRACELVATLTQEGIYVGDLLNAKLIRPLVQIINTDEFVRFKAMEVITDCTSGLANHIRFLVEKKDIVKALANSFSLMKTYDKVLGNFYNYYGPSFNFSFINNIVKALSNLLRVAEDQGEIFMSYFDKDVMKKMKDAIGSLLEEEKSMPLGDQKSSLECAKKVRKLLAVIGEQHSRVRIQGWEQMCSTLKKDLQDFDAKLRRKESEIRRRSAQKPKDRSQSTSHDTKDYRDPNVEYITVKCLYDGEERTFTGIPKNIGVAGLENKLLVSFGRDVLLRFKEDGKWKDLTPSTWGLAMDTMINDTLELFLKAKYGSTASFQTNQYFGSGGQPDWMRKLAMDTGFTANEVHKLFKYFKSSTKGGDEMELGVFCKALPLGKVFNQAEYALLFKSFIRGNKPRLDFVSLVKGISSMRSDDRQKRHRMCFNAYDEDGDGVLTREEFRRILEAKFGQEAHDLIEICMKHFVEPMNFEAFWEKTQDPNMRIQSFWLRKLKR